MRTIEIDKELLLVEVPKPKQAEEKTIKGNLLLIKKN